MAEAEHTSHQSTGFSLWKTPSCDDKLEKLGRIKNMYCACVHNNFSGTYIPQLVKKVESNQDALECANEQLRSDLQRWQLEKQQYLKKVLLDFVNRQIDFYETSVSAWEQASTEITGQQNTTNISK